MISKKKYLYSDHWDGVNYRRVSSPQFFINMRFIDRFTFKGSESVLDIGCGSGDTTREIAKRVPGGCVIGVDASLSMIEEAARTQILNNLHFQVLNAQDVNFRNKFDLVSSFFCMQWVQNKAEVFCSINQALKLNGKFMMIVPMPHPHLPKIRNKLINQPHWAPYFVGYEDPLTFINDNNYIRYANNAGMQVEITALEHDPVYFPRYEDFFNFMYEMTPHLKQLPNEELKNAFMHELLDEYVGLYSLNMKGEYLLDFNLQKMVCSR